MSISDLRQSYDDAPSWNEADAACDPMDQFADWFAQAVEAGIKEPNAMTLATVDLDGQPDARIVLLKDADQRGFTFYTNYASAKARQIERQHDVALVFYWDVLFRSVRIRGPIVKTSREEAAAYWATRPRGSQIGALASPQSRTLKSREELETAFQAVADRVGPDLPIPLPDNWGGYRVIPKAIEFWQGQPSRLHDRLLYLRDAEGWQIKRLAP